MGKDSKAEGHGAEADPLCQTNSEEPRTANESQINEIDTKELTLEHKIASLIEKEETVFKCKECGKIAAWQSHMKQHVEKHIEGFEHKCRLCSSVHKTRNGLSWHMYHQHSAKKKECKYCDFKTSTPRNLRIHELTKHQGLARNAVVAAIKLFSKKLPKQSFNCDKCTFRSDKACRLKQHQQTRHEGLRIECSKCGNKFARKDSLKSHFLLVHSDIMHSDKPKQPCNQCSFTTTTESHLKEHKGRIHNLKGATTTRIKEHAYVYQCNFCNMTFRRKKLMQRHTNKFHVEGATKYPCDDCNAEFDTEKHLRLHKQCLHNSRGMGDVRSLCPKACTGKAGLSHHLKFYHEEIRNQCDKCNFWSTKRRQLVRHNDNMHKRAQ